MQVAKSHGLQDESANWRPERADGFIQSKSEVLRTRRGNDAVLVQRLASLRPRKIRCFSLSPKARKKVDVPILRLLGRKNSLVFWERATLLLYSGLPTLGRAICFTLSTNLNINCIQKALTETPRIMFEQIFGHPVAWSS